MPEKIEKGPLTPNLVDKINEALKELGSTARWTKAPEFLKEYRPLKDKTIVLVDDVDMVLKAFVPGLMVATDGKAFFVQYKGQPLQELTEQILQRNPDLILLDYNLEEEGELKGTELARELLRQKFSGDIVGFSSERAAEQEFQKVGVKRSINKEAGFPEESIKELAELVKPKEEPGVKSEPAQ